MAKEDLTSFFEKAKENNVQALVQKVVEVKKIKNKKIPLSLRIGLKQYYDLIKFKDHKIVFEKNPQYNLTEAFLYGITLLEKKYAHIERGREKIKLARGRRISNGEEYKDTSLLVSQEVINFLNDYFYHKIIVEGNTTFRRQDFFEELVSLIVENNKEIFKN